MYRSEVPPFEDTGVTDSTVASAKNQIIDQWLRELKPNVLNLMPISAWKAFNYMLNRFPFNHQITIILISDNQAHFSFQMQIQSLASLTSWDIIGSFFDFVKGPAVNANFFDFDSKIKR